MFRLCSATCYCGTVGWGQADPTGLVLVKPGPVLLVAALAVFPGFWVTSNVATAEVSNALDAYRLPLSGIRDADLVVVLGDVALEQSAPIVDLWVKAARRKGATVLHELNESAVRKAVFVRC